MRLLLDAMLSWRIAKQLREHNFDVAALNEDPVREDLDDPAVLELASNEHRAVVTYNVAHFLQIDKEWREGGREHAGIVLVAPGLPNSAIGEITRALESLLTNKPHPEALRGQIVWLKRTPR